MSAARSEDTEAERRARAVRAAGNLAEAGVTRLFLIRPGGEPEQLTPRATDLPGRLATAECGTELRDDGGAVLVRVGADGATMPAPHGT